MKKRQLRLMALALMLTTGFSLTGCEESTAVNPTNPESIYALAVENGYTGTYEDWVNLLKGDKGDTGTQGPKGDKGDSGEKGEKGDKGDTGDKGDKGDKGEAGSQGEKGDKGDKGDSGISIVKIEKTSSENGVDTYTITYSDNTTSTFQVTNGKDGTNASVSISEDGYWIVNGTKTDIPVTGSKGDKGDTGEKGEKGDTGAQGEKGDKGDKGTDGTSWHTGKGAPDISLTALEGDFYFDTESGCIYKYSDSKWVLIYQIAKNVDCQFTVTLDLNGGVYDGETTFTVPYGGFIEQLPEPIKFGMEFVGFYTGLSKNDMQFTTYTPVYRDMNLIAVYDETTLQKHIKSLKSHLYNNLRNFTDDYEEMTEEEKNDFMQQIALLDKSTSTDEADLIYSQCISWMESVFNNWKHKTKMLLSRIISEVETMNPDYVSYLETIQSSVNDWDETYNFAESGIRNVCDIIYSLANNKRSLSDKGNFENEFINSRNAYAEILTRLLGDYKKAVQASDDWAKAKEYFSTYNEESTIKEYLENIVFILGYIPNNIIDPDFKDPDAIKTYMTDEKKDLLSEQYYSNYQPVLDRVFSLIDSNSSEEDCRLIVSMFSVVSDFCRSQAPDDFSSNVTDFIHWYNYDVGAIKFTTDDFIKILTEEESIDDESMTNLFYMEKKLDIVEYLNGRRDPEERYRQSNMVYQYFMNSRSITVEKLQTIKTYLDSYMTREYTFDLTPSIHELDLLLNLSDKDLDTDTISSSIADEFVHQADYNRQQLVDNDYYLKDDDTEYDKLIENISTIEENTTIKEFLDNYDKAMDYLYQNSVFDESKSLERYKENAKGYLNEEFKTSDAKDVPEEYSYDFTDTEAFKAFVAKIDAIDSLEEFKKLANDQQLFITLMKDVSKEKKEDAKKLWQLMFDNMNSEMTDEEKTSFEKALKEFKDNPTDDLVDTIVEIYSNIILRFQSSSNQ